MTLAEKITVLRGERKLSQGDLAERLDVSRQSVSKWETGQAVPELDKIIKLADLFGVTVDELVRDGETPSPEAPKPEVVYVERRHTPAQTLGIMMIIGGLVMMVLALLTPGLLFIGAFIAITGLPLLLAKKHPFLMTGWVVWAMAYLLLCTPFFTGAPWQPFTPIIAWFRSAMANDRYAPTAVWLMWLAYLLESALTIVLPLLTVRLWLRKGREKQQTAQKIGG